MTDADVAALIGEHVRAFNDRDIDALMSGFIAAAKIYREGSAEVA